MKSMIKKLSLAALINLAAGWAVVAQGGTFVMTFGNNTSPAAAPLPFTVTSSGCTVNRSPFAAGGEFRMVGRTPETSSTVCKIAQGLTIATWTKDIFFGGGSETWSFDEANNNRMTATAGFPSNLGATNAASPAAPTMGTNSTVQQNAPFSGNPFNFLAPTTTNLAGSYYGPATISASKGAGAFTVTFPTLEAQYGDTYFPFANVVFSCSSSPAIQENTATNFRCYAEHLISTAEDPGSAGFIGFVAQWETVGTLFVPVDTVAPTVSNVNPAVGATFVPGNAALTVNFSEQMAAASVNNVSFSLKRTSDNLPIAGAVTGSGNTYTFTPGSTLVNGTNYTAMITTAVTDAAVTPNALTTNYTWTFTAGPPDTQDPSVLSTTPASGAINVASNATISITFSEAMDSASVASAFNLADSSGTPISVGTPTTIDNVTFVFRPAAALTAGITYTATISAAAKDVAQRVLPLTSWSFTTASAGTTGGGALSVPASGPAGGGCTIARKAEFDLSLLFSLIASLGYVGWKRRRD